MHQMYLKSNLFIINTIDQLCFVLLFNLILLFYMCIYKIWYRICSLGAEPRPTDLGKFSKQAACILFN